VPNPLIIISVWLAMWTTCVSISKKTSQWWILSFNLAWTKALQYFKQTFMTLFPKSMVVTWSSNIFIFLYKTFLIHNNIVFAKESLLWQSWGLPSGWSKCNIHTYPYNRLNPAFRWLINFFKANWGWFSQMAIITHLSFTYCEGVIAYQKLLFPLQI